MSNPPPPCAPPPCDRYARGTPLLEVRDLRVNFKVFGGELRVLDGVNLVVHAGEKVGLVGESGCGKTTTMKAILRILPMPPARIVGGQVLFHGKDVSGLRDEELRHLRGRGMSMIFQDPTAALNPVFTVGQQLGDVIKYSRITALPPPPCDNRGLPQRQGTLAGGDTGSAAHASPVPLATRLRRQGTTAATRGDYRRQAALNCLREVSLADPERLLDSYPIQLSGGMRQRVCIAMALATQPELLIADEPGTSLDVTIQDQILRLLRNLVTEKNTSVILITHTLGVVREVTDRVYVMYAGAMVESAPTKALFANPMFPYTRGLMQSVPRLSGGGVAEGIPGRIPNYLNPPTGCRFHPRCPHVMDICRQEKPPVCTVGEEHYVACYLYGRGADRGLEIG